MFSKLSRRIAAVRDLLRDFVAQCVIHNARLQRNAVNCGKLRDRYKRVGLIRAALQLVDRCQRTLNRSLIQVGIRTTSPSCACSTMTFFT